MSEHEHVETPADATVLQAHYDDFVAGWSEGRSGLVVDLDALLRASAVHSYRQAAVDVDNVRRALHRKARTEHEHRIAAVSESLLLQIAAMMREAADRFEVWGEVESGTDGATRGRATDD